MPQCTDLEVRRGNQRVPFDLLNNERPAGFPSRFSQLQYDAA